MKLDFYPILEFIDILKDNYIKYAESLNHIIFNINGIVYSFNSFSNICVIEKRISNEQYIIEIKNYNDYVKRINLLIKYLKEVNNDELE